MKKTEFAIFFLFCKGSSEKMHQNMLTFREIPKNVIPFFHLMCDHLPVLDSESNPYLISSFFEDSSFGPSSSEICYKLSMMQAKSLGMTWLILTRKYVLQAESRTRWALNRFPWQQSVTSVQHSCSSICRRHDGSCVCSPILSVFSSAADILEKNKGKINVKLLQCDGQHRYHQKQY